jgi:uncharacterized damage-inducible protein DinB
MTAARRLADHITRTITGPMWHGPALAEVLAGVSAAEAASRPIAGAHSIWELVLHVAGWAEVARARLTSGEPVVPDEDWPAVPAPTPEHWHGAVERLRVSYERLAQTVEGMDDAALLARVSAPGPRHSAEVMLHGVIEHGTYHGGQIAILRRALASTAAPNA